MGKNFEKSIKGIVSLTLGLRDGTSYLETYWIGDG